MNQTNVRSSVQVLFSAIVAIVLICSTGFVVTTPASAHSQNHDNTGVEDSHHGHHGHSGHDENGHGHNDGDDENDDDEGGDDTDTLPVVVDVCTNIDGDQLAVPEGYTALGTICTVITQPIDSNTGTTTASTTPTGTATTTDSTGSPQAATTTDTGGQSGSTATTNNTVEPPHGGGGNGPVNGFGINHAIVPRGGVVLGTSTESSVEAPACGPLVTHYLRMGKNNDTGDVKKLQTFLNKDLGLSLVVDGVFGQATFDAVSKFQDKYFDQVLAPWVRHGLSSSHTTTGYVYKTTIRMINKANCASLDVPMPQLP